MSKRRRTSRNMAAFFGGSHRRGDSTRGLRRHESSTGNSLATRSCRSSSSNCGNVLLGIRRPEQEQSVGSGHRCRPALSRVHRGMAVAELGPDVSDWPARAIYRLCEAGAAMGRLNSSSAGCAVGYRCRVRVPCREGNAPGARCCEAPNWVKGNLLVGTGEERGQPCTSCIIVKGGRGRSRAVLLWRSSRRKWSRRRRPARRENLFRAAVEKVNARVWKQSDGRPGHAPRPAERKADVSSLGLHECDSTLRRRLSHPVARRDAFFRRDLAPPFRTLSNLTCKVNPIIIAYGIFR